MDPLGDVLNRYERLLQRKCPRCLFYVENMHLYRQLAADCADRYGPDVALATFTQWYKADLDRYLSVDTASISFEMDLANRRKELDIKKKWFFCTIGFDDKIITETGIKDTIRKLDGIKGIEIAHLVAEKHRRNPAGELYIHHHIHMLVDTDYPKSKVIQYVFQRVKKYVGSSNFIDVKNDGDRERYEKYINGDKTSEKLDLVEMDRKWRLEHNIC